MLIEDFNITIDHWIGELEKYTFSQLCTKPSPALWSLGQVYMHLIESTSHYVDQAKVCLSSDDHQTEEASPSAKEMFENNALPDILIEGPSSNRNTQQPDSKEQLLSGLMNLKAEIDKIGVLNSESPFKGKTKHPGLKYFSAHEWLHFAEMHFRHHLRQKKRIDGFLRANPVPLQD